MDRLQKKLKNRLRGMREPASFSHKKSTEQSNRSESIQNSDSVAANANKDNTEFLNRSGSNQNADYVVVNANTDNTEFVNHAFILWTEMRQQWVGNQHRNKAIQQAKPLLRSNTSYYERLLESKIPFPRSIPLREMIEFLRNVWKEEGLYEEGYM